MPEKNEVVTITVALDLDPEVHRFLLKKAAKARKEVKDILVHQILEAWDDTLPCAVKGCDAPGEDHKCPPCGDWLHHHGRIHYDRAEPGHGLTFRPNGWRLLCAAHFDHLRAFLPRRYPFGGGPTAT